MNQQQIDGQDGITVPEREYEHIWRAAFKKEARFSVFEYQRTSVWSALAQTGDHQSLWSVYTYHVTVTHIIAHYIYRCLEMQMYQLHQSIQSKQNPPHGRAFPLAGLSQTILRQFAFPLPVENLLIAVSRSQDSRCQIGFLIIWGRLVASSSRFKVNLSVIKCEL